MGTIKTTNIEPIADNGTVTLGSSGDTITVPTGVIMSGQNYPAFKAVLTSSQAISANTETVVQINNEVFDIGGYFNTSTYRFTPPAGKYCFIGNVGNGEFENFLDISIVKNGSKVSENVIQLNSRKLVQSIQLESLIK